MNHKEIEAQLKWQFELAESRLNQIKQRNIWLEGIGITRHLEEQNAAYEAYQRAGIKLEDFRHVYRCELSVIRTRFTLQMTKTIFEQFEVNRETALENIRNRVPTWTPVFDMVISIPIRKQTHITDTPSPVVEYEREDIQLKRVADFYFGYSKHSDILFWEHR